MTVACAFVKRLCAKMIRGTWFSGQLAVKDGVEQIILMLRSITQDPIMQDQRCYQGGMSSNSGGRDQLPRLLLKEGGSTCLPIYFLFSLPSALFLDVPKNPIMEKFIAKAVLVLCQLQLNFSGNIILPLLLKTFRFTCLTELYLLPSGLRRQCWVGPKVNPRLIYFECRSLQLSPIGSFLRKIHLYLLFIWSWSGICIASITCMQEMPHFAKIDKLTWSWQQVSNFVGQGDDGGAMYASSNQYICAQDLH